jgi:hypothetical protein
MVTIIFYDIGKVKCLIPIVIEQRSHQKPKLVHIAGIPYRLTLWNALTVVSMPRNALAILEDKPNTNVTNVESLSAQSAM